MSLVGHDFRTQAGIGRKRKGGALYPVTSRGYVPKFDRAIHHFNLQAEARNGQGRKRKGGAHGVTTRARPSITTFKGGERVATGGRGKQILPPSDTETFHPAGYQLGVQRISGGRKKHHLIGGKKGGRRHIEVGDGLHMPAPFTQQHISVGRTNPGTEVEQRDFRTDSTPSYHKEIRQTHAGQGFRHQFGAIRAGIPMRL